MVFDDHTSCHYANCVVVSDASANHPCALLQIRDRQWCLSFSSMGWLDLLPYFPSAWLWRVHLCLTVSWHLLQTYGAGHCFAWGSGRGIVGHGGVNVNVW